MPPRAYSRHRGNRRPPATSADADCGRAGRIRLGHDGRGTAASRARIIDRPADRLLGRQAHDEDSGPATALSLEKADQPHLGRTRFGERRRHVLAESGPRIACRPWRSPAPRAAAPVRGVIRGDPQVRALVPTAPSSSVLDRLADRAVRALDRHHSATRCAGNLWGRVLGGGVGVAGPLVSGTGGPPAARHRIAVRHRPASANFHVPCLPLPCCWFTRRAVSNQRDPVPGYSGLYIVATPIGESRRSHRAGGGGVGALDAVACEDTRVTRELVRHLGVAKPLWRYDDHASRTGRGSAPQYAAQGGGAGERRGHTRGPRPGLSPVRDARAEGSR